LVSEMAAMLGALPTGLGPSLVTLDLATAEPMALSKGLPAVLGVLADPNDANAPEPRPKALEAPPVGDVKPAPGVLKGLALPPCDDVSPPWRREKGAARDESPAEEPLGPFDEVERESLPELQGKDISCCAEAGRAWVARGELLCATGP